MDALTIVSFVIMAVLVYLIITAKKQGKYQFDERQEAIRYHSYKYGFVAIVISNFVLLFLVEYLKIKITPNFLLLAPLLIGCFAFVGYAIFKGAYVAMNERNLKFNAVLLIVVGIWELITSIHGLVASSTKWETNTLAILLGLFLIFIGIGYAYQLYSNKVKK